MTPHLPAQNEPAPAGFLQRTVESSVVLRPLRDLCRGSGVCRLLIRPCRSLAGRTSWIGTRVARHDATRVFPRATGIAATSAVFGGVDRWFAMVPYAWRDSQVKRWLDRTIGPLETSQRVRLLGWVVFAAATTHALLATAALLESSRALILWMGASAVGLTLITAAEPLAAAWRSRR